MAVTGARAARKASTTAGANWVPAFFRSSAHGLGFRSRAHVAAIGGHGRVGVAHEHDLRAERDLVAREPIRVARPVPALVAGADQRRDADERGRALRDPLADQRVALHELPLVGVERAGLVEDRARDGDLADVVQLGRDHDALDLVLVETEAARDLRGQRRHLVGVPPQLGHALLHRAPQHARALQAGRHAPAVLLGVEAAVRHAQRLVGVIGVARQRGGAGGRPDREAFALLGQRRAGALDQRLGRLAGRPRGEHAELVAADAERRAVGGRRGRQEAGAEPGQQRVAGRVPVGVVVVLEAVEVEHQQHVRHRLGQRVVERAVQREAVAEPRERVRARLDARADEVGAAGPVGEREPDERRGERGGGEPEREQVDPLEVVVDEQREARQREPDRRDDAGQLVAGGAPAHGGLPRGEADQQRAQRPADVEQRPGGVRALGDLHEVDRVGDGEDGDARAEEQPAAVHATAAGRHDADQRAEQDHVAERVGEVRRHRGGVTARRGVHGAEDDRRADRAGREGGDEAVQPQPRVQLRQPLAGEQQDAEVADGKEGEPQAVRDRGIRRFFEIGERELPVEVAARPQRERDADQRPGDPLVAAERAAGEAEHRRPDQRGVVEHLVHRVQDVQPRGRIHDGHERDEGDEERRPGCAPRAASRPTRCCRAPAGRRARPF